MKLCDMTIHELAALLRAGEVTSTEITESVFDRIDQVEESVGAYVTTARDQAFEQAAAQISDCFKRGKRKSL